MRYAIHLPNFADPAELVQIGVDAEEAGWDGLFLWDHLFGGPEFPVPMADPWVVLGALAERTEDIRLGTAVTPLARRRPQKVAREAVTVDHLSGGRMVLGVGLGSPVEVEYGRFGETTDPVNIAGRLDEALTVITGLWTGELVDHEGDHFTVRQAQFLPPPVQQPRIPIWVACGLDSRSPLRRAARWDAVVLAAMNDQGGVDPITAPQFRTILDDLTELRGGLHDFDIAVVSDGLPDDETTDRYLAHGATWILVTAWIGQLHELASHAPRATSKV